MYIYICIYILYLPLIYHTYLFSYIPLLHLYVIHLIRFRIRFLIRCRIAVSKKRYYISDHDARGQSVYQHVRVCVYVCLCTYPVTGDKDARGQAVFQHTYIYIYIYIYIYVRMYVYTYVCMYMYVCIFIYIHTYTYMYVCVCVCVCVCMCVCVCACVCVCVCVYIQTS